MAGLGVEFDPGDLERLRTYIELLLEANRTTNLTGITNPPEVWMKHIYDSLSLVPAISTFLAARPDSEQRPSLVDIGSGGGVPALPLAIIFPELRFTLVEATGKKVEFLRHAATTLGLKNVDVVKGRAETLGQDHRVHREKYDLGTARALGHLAVLAELLGPLLRPGAIMLAIKGAKADQELTEAQKAMGLVGLRHLETLQHTTNRLVILEKATRTPRLYPRKDGEPARLPLGMQSSAAKGPGASRKP